MNKFTSTIFAFLVLALVSCSKDEGNSDGEGGININNLSTNLATIATTTLNDTEQAGLLQMREEERLAYDVYLKLYEKWGNKVFQNIALKSEDSHMQAMLLLLNRYGLPDPMSETAGVFSSTVLQQTYNALVAQGMQSEIEALKVGCEVEELDINDLNTFLSKNDNADIQVVYDLLNKGSRNHLRSFNKNLNNLGATYSAKHLSQAEYDAIANSAKETGN